MRITTLFLAASFISSSVFISQSAVAAPASNKQYEVHYSQSELSSAASAARILVRIQQTARLVCKDEFGGARHLRKLDVQRCNKEITQDLVRKVGHENMNRAYMSMKEKRPSKTYTIAKIELAKPRVK